MAGWCKGMKEGVWERSELKEGVRDERKGQGRQEGAREGRKGPRRVGNGRKGPGTEECGQGEKEGAKG